jgi:hypothetical protein
MQFKTCNDFEGKQSACSLRTAESLKENNLINLYLEKGVLGEGGVLIGAN